MKTKSVEEYIKGAAPKARPMLRKMRGIIKKTAPRATEKISYGMPMFFHHGMLVAYGAFKEHVGFYALTTKIVRKYKKELGKYSTATSTIRFPFGEALPEKLIKKMVREKIKMNEEKNQLKIKKQAR